MSSSKHKNDSDSIWQRLLVADEQRNVCGVSQQAMLLLLFGHVPSLSALENQLRLRGAATHLIAHPFSSKNVPIGTICLNPLASSSVDGASDADSQKYFVNFSVEDAESTARQLAAVGADSPQENLRRLRNEYCGFLIRNSSDLAWASGLKDFHGQLQADCATEATALVALPACASCSRFPTKLTQLRKLDCCNEDSQSLYACSPQCWRAHVDRCHSEE